MSRGIRRQVPVLVVASVALVAALGGTVYAAGKINGHAIKVKSLPGNRLAIGSVPANRLKPGAIPSLQLAPGSIQGDRLAPGSVQGDRLAPGSVPGDRLAPGSVTGVQVDVSTLGQVPSAVHADRADSAIAAETALNAVNAENARSLNGYEAGCAPGTRPFAGACWQTVTNSTALTPANAATACANEGGELPDPLLLAAFSQQPNITIASGDEWTSDIPVVSGSNTYAVVTVSPAGAIGSSPGTNTKKFRCVIPLVG